MGNEKTMTDDQVYYLCEAVADIAMNMQAKEWEWKPEDSRRVISIIISWATEFENMNHGRIWDGEYMDEIDAFFEKKYKELHDLEG